MSEQQFDAGEIQDEQVDVGAQAPEEGGNSRAPEPAPPVEVAEEAVSEEPAADRTDASGRVLNPWESAPKAAKEN